MAKNAKKRHFWSGNPGDPEIFQSDLLHPPNLPQQPPFGIFWKSLTVSEEMQLQNGLKMAQNAKNGIFLATLSGNPEKKLGRFSLQILFRNFKL